MKVAYDPKKDPRILDKQNELKRLESSLDKKIQSKENEINNLNELYKKKVENVKSENENRYYEVLDRDQERIASSSKEAEEKIQKYSDELKSTRLKLASDQENLKKTEKEKIDSLKIQLEDQFTDQFTSTLDQQKNINQSLKNDIKKISLQAAGDKLNAERSLSAQSSALMNDLNQKNVTNEREFRRRIENEVTANQNELIKRQKDFKLQAQETDKKNKYLLNEKESVLKNQLDFQDKFQNSLLVQRDSDFKTRYETIVKEHQTILKDLESSFLSDVKKMREKTLQDKSFIEDKLTDSFYRIDKLNPELIETPESVIVKLKVAPYEKENVHLSARDRLVKLTLARKFTDTIVQPDGVVDRSTRSELFSKELKTIDILNPKSITQKYEDGFLQFKISKL